MANIDTIKDSLQNYGKDIRINLSSVLSEEGSPELNISQIWGIALCCAFFTKERELVLSFLEEAKSKLDETHIEACKSASTIMAMNNIYYRFTHLCDNESISKLPAKLRMTSITTHGIDKIDFELYSVAISSLAGCGMCIKSHTNILLKSGVSAVGIQSSIRIAAVINALWQGYSISKTTTS